MENQKELRDFTFTNDYVFCSILTENPHICKKIAELAIGRKIKEIVKVQAQKSIKKSKDGKGVRFDVVFEDDENNVYDIEMQKVKRGNIPKRARYYQSMLDLESLGKGRNKPYSKLKNGYIIFICGFDIFGKGDCRYIARTMVEGHPDCDYDDGSRKVFLNAYYTQENMDLELRAFLDYVKNGMVESDLVSEIEEIKNKLLNDAERRAEFMTLQDTCELYKEEGKLENMLDLVNSGMLKLEDAITKSGLTEAEFNQALEEYRKSVATQ